MVYSGQVSKPKRDVWVDEHLNAQSYSTGLRVSKQYIKLMNDDLEVSHRVDKPCMKIYLHIVCCFQIGFLTTDYVIPIAFSGEFVIQPNL